MSKNVLLIAGGGTLGTATAEELLQMGCAVDIICPEAKESRHPRLTYIRDMVSEELLRRLFADKHYHGIINFMHYFSAEEYAPMHTLLTAHTDHLIFLSSYRVYGDAQHPITEDAPLLVDTVDAAYLAQETYAVPKIACERYMLSTDTANWTAVRPVISFSQYRLDVVMRSGTEVVDAAREGRAVTLPAGCRHLTAGLDWAGNTGKLIAHLLWKPAAYRRAFTVSSGQNLTWEQVADIYTDLLGVQFVWQDTDVYVQQNPVNPYGLYCDRLYDRVVDNRRILEVTGLTEQDFLPMREGVICELKKLGVL